MDVGCWSKALSPVHPLQHGRVVLSRILCGSSSCWLPAAAGFQQSWTEPTQAASSSRGCDARHAGSIALQNPVAAVLLQPLSLRQEDGCSQKEGSWLQMTDSSLARDLPPLNDTGGLSSADGTSFCWQQPTVEALLPS